MLFKNLRVHQIFGANTEVGKTLFATALCRTAALAGEASHYLKPVGTGGHGDDWSALFTTFTFTVPLNAAMQACFNFLPKNTIKMSPLL